MWESCLDVPKYLLIILPMLVTVLSLNIITSTGPIVTSTGPIVNTTGQMENLTARNTWQTNTRLLSCIVFIKQRDNNIVIQQYQFSNSFKRYHCIEELLISNDNLLDITNLSDNITLNYAECYLVILNKLQNSFYGNTLEHTHSILPPLVQHIYPTDLGAPSTPFVIACTDHVYINSYLRVVQYFSLEVIIIFVDENICRKEFANTLNNQIENSIVHVISFTQTNFVRKLLWQLNGGDRIYILLTSKETTLFVLEHAKKRGIEGPNNIWVIPYEENFHHDLPYITMIIGKTDYQVYEPKLMNYRNNSLTPSLKCIEEPNKIVIPHQLDTWMWHGEIYRKLFRATLLNGSMQYLLYESEVELGHEQTKLKSVKMVSVIGGPFLAEAYYLYNNVTKNCESSSLKCRKFDMTTQTWSYTCCYGYVVDFYLWIGKLLNFQVDLYSMEDGKYGGYNEETKTWNGMVGSVIAGDAIMATPLTINTERLAAIDFSIPFIRVEIGIATKIANDKFPYFNMRFLNHITTNSLMAAFAFFFISVILIFIYDNLVLLYKKKVNNKNRKRKVLKSYSGSECFSYVAGIMFQRDIGGLNPSTAAARAMALFCAFGMVALVTLYTASLTVDQVTKSTSNEFLGLSDTKMIYPTDEFTFGTVSDTSTEDFFHGSPNEDFERMYKFMLNYNVDKTKDAIPKLLNGELGAFLHDRPFLMYEIAREAACKIAIHQNDVGTISYGLALQKNSSWRLPVSEAVTYLKDEGILGDLEKKWLNFDCPKSDQGEFATFDLTFFATPTALLLATALFSTFILLLELYYNKYIKSRRSQYSLNN